MGLVRSAWEGMNDFVGHSVSFLDTGDQKGKSLEGPCYLLTPEEVELYGITLGVCGRYDGRIEVDPKRENAFEESLRVLRGNAHSNYNKLPWYFLSRIIAGDDGLTAETQIASFVARGVDKRSVGERIMHPKTAGKNKRIICCNYSGFHVSTYKSEYITFLDRLKEMGASQTTVI